MSALTAEEIAIALDGKKCGQEWRTHCPVHQGSNRNFYITEKNGRLLFHCFVGCSQESVINELKALGLWPVRDKVSQRKPRIDIDARLKKQEPKPRSATLPKAIEFWRRADNDEAMVADHPYARRKRITHSFGARRGIAGGRVLGYNADCIVVPNRNWDGEFIGVECINPEGKKQTFGNKGILILGNPEDAPLIHLCEGWATAYALSQMFPHRFATIVCFGKQIEKAVPEVSKRYSGRLVIHEESPKNRDAWDIWHAGYGDTYIKNILGALS